MKYNLKRADYQGDWNGFTLKPGFYYGHDEDGNSVATSTWECDGYLAVYTREPGIHGNWQLGWANIEDDDFSILDPLPEINLDGKLSFREWLEEAQGIGWNDYDEDYSGVSQDDLEAAYNNYLYDGLPRFIQKLL